MDRAAKLKTEWRQGQQCGGHESVVVEFILKRQLPLGQTVQNSIANQVTLKGIVVVSPHAACFFVYNCIDSRTLLRHQLCLQKTAIFSSHLC